MMTTAALPSDHVIAWGLWDGSGFLFVLIVIVWLLEVCLLTPLHQPVLLSEVMVGGSLPLIWIVILYG